MSIRSSSRRLHEDPYGQLLQGQLVIGNDPCYISTSRTKPAFSPEKVGAESLPSQDSCHVNTLAENKFTKEGAGGSKLGVQPKVAPIRHDSSCTSFTNKILPKFGCPKDL